MTIRMFLSHFQDRSLVEDVVLRGLGYELDTELVDLEEINWLEGEIEQEWRDWQSCGGEMTGAEITLGQCPTDADW